MIASRFPSRFRNGHAKAGFLARAGAPAVAAVLIPVDDPRDPRIEPYRAIRERDLVGREGRFIAEGEVVLRVLARAAARLAVESLLVAEKRVAALARSSPSAAAGVPVYVAPQAVMERDRRLPDPSRHPGARPARADAPARPRCSPSAGRGALVVGLFGIANHDNMGGIFRNAAAFGADAVLLDATCCDPLYRKAIRVSVGAALIVPFARGGTRRRRSSRCSRRPGSRRSR